MNQQILFVDMLERQNKELREFNRELVDMLRLCTGLNVVDDMRKACEAKRAQTVDDTPVRCKPWFENPLSFVGSPRNFDPKDDNDSGC